MKPTALLEKSKGISPMLAACPILDAVAHINQIPVDGEPCYHYYYNYYYSYMFKLDIQWEKQVVNQEFHELDHSSHIFRFLLHSSELLREN